MTTPDITHRRSKAVSRVPWIPNFSATQCEFSFFLGVDTVSWAWKWRKITSDPGVASDLAADCSIKTCGSACSKQYIHTHVQAQ